MVKKWTDAEMIDFADYVEWFTGDRACIPHCTFICGSKKCIRKLLKEYKMDREREYDSTI